MSDKQLPDDPSHTTRLTEQKAADLNAEPGRGARPVPGAHMHEQEVDQHLSSDSSADLLDPEEGPRETRNK
ncbi:hypothetical protein LAJ19_00815 [Deinococcus taeanensis]|uniref:hypothetical protein n=1 Tax=Deinococcus taeanensis TaxID=2737050 RepID=UPI001CDBBD03|nr:hypothetical protein [Deinococcus taeanensis]UBV42809.1 hypothetical protein LAJ19_00815 [Deinococcus taeanensis]